MKIRYYIDPETGLPHFYKHNISEFEVETVLEKPGEDRPGKEGSRIAIGQAENGKYIRVIYVPEPEINSIFVITAYEITGNILKAYRRRRRRKLL
jgi:hypothetical protein